VSKVETVAELLGTPVPPFVDVIALVVLVFKPPEVSCTDTVITQLPPAGIVPPLKVSVVSPATGAKVPPQVSVAFGGFATTNPAGNASVNATPVNATVGFGLVNVKVSVVVPPTGTTEAPKALLIVGGANTVIVAVLLVVPGPPFVDVTAPVVLFLTPAVVPVTVTENMHVPLAAIVAPVSVIWLLPVIVSVPPHCDVVPLATDKPAGNVSVNPTPVSATVAFGFEMVNERVVVWFSGTVGAAKALPIVGGATTVRVAVLLVDPGPVSVALTGPLVLFFTPGVAPVTITLIMQLPPAPIEPPVSEIVPGAVVVSVPPPQVVELPFATVRPAGRVSVNATPVIASDAFGLVIVNVSDVVVPTGIVAAPNALLIVGGAATVTVAVLLVVPVPPLVEVTAPVVLCFTP